MELQRKCLEDHCLEDLRKSEPPDLAAGEAKMLLSSINVEFLLCLEIATPVFLETSLASNALQQKDLDLAAAYSVVDGVLKRVEELRTTVSSQRFSTQPKQQQRQQT